MKKILFFDIDGTIARRGEGIEADLLDLLDDLSYRYEVVLITGNTAEYVIGMMRQANKLKNIAIICESGGLIYDSPVLPTSKIYEHTNIENANNTFCNAINNMKNGCKERVIKIATSETSMTFIFGNETDLKKSFNLLKNNNKNKRYTIYRHTITIDILNNEVNKGFGVLKYLNIKGYDRNKVFIHTFGDGVNDIPMFMIANKVTIVGDIKYKEVCDRLDSVGDMVSFLTNEYK